MEVPRTLARRAGAGSNRARSRALFPRAPDVPGDVVDGISQDAVFFSAGSGALYLTRDLNDVPAGVPPGKRRCNEPPSLYAFS